MTKRALVVGINDYSSQLFQGNPVKSLSCAVSDATSIYSMLVNALGFEVGNIYYYADKDASRDAIMNALHYITSAGEAGDVACFYYSGHGARLSADPSKADCNKFYETIVPASGDLITDREIYQIADALQPSFVNFTLILDSCYSGGIYETDSALQCRTIAIDDALLQSMVSYMNTLIPCGVCIPPDTSVLDENVHNVSEAANRAVILDEEPDRTLIQFSKSTLIAASQFSEVSWEDASLKHGLLTQSFLDIVISSNFQITYLDLMTRLRTRVQDYLTKLILPNFPAVTQVPQLRGQMNRMTEGFLEGWRDSR